MEIGMCLISSITTNNIYIYDKTSENPLFERIYMNLRIKLIYLYDNNITIYFCQRNIIIDFCDFL